MSLPRYPGAPAPDEPPDDHGGRGVRIALALLLALVVAAMLLHLVGAVGPGGR